MSLMVCKSRKLIAKICEVKIIVYEKARYTKLEFG